jgi:alkanesulfonate monooxygenase SsuD/methylene tetrahydromethanopterin reductase-like flavin-dependent oxidoreductase (luciferase family)
LRISVTLPQFTMDPPVLVNGARRAEALGFDGVFLFDHLFPLDGSDRPVVDAITSLGAVIAGTRSISVGTLVLRTSMRVPEVTAGAVLTAEALSGGRLVCGLGSGDSLSKPEFETYGLPFPEERLSSLRDTIRLVRAASGMPIWVGGTSREIQELAAELADGWNVWGVTAEWIERRRAAGPTPPAITWGGQVLLASDQSRLEEAVRKRRSTRGVLLATVASLPGALGALAAAGVDEFVLSLLGDSWGLFADEVKPLL